MTDSLHEAHAATAPDLSDLAVPDSMRLLDDVLPPAPGTICEVGCGRGALAAALVAAGYQVTGLEPNAEAAAVAQRRGVSVLVEGLLEHRTPDGYDAILFTRSLHHIENLDAAVSHALALLRPTGRLILEEFAWERADPAAAAFVFDTISVLDAAGLTRPADDVRRESAGHEHAGHEHAGHGAAAAQHGGSDDPAADPWQRWQQGFRPADDDEDPSVKPLHPGGEIATVLTGHGLTVRESETPGLWRIVAQRLGDTAAARPVARTVRAVEQRRIDDGSLPALGRFLLATR
ncbi:MAG: methyltransferase domain-containing protein [Actinocatenispora sp.]